MVEKKTKTTAKKTAAKKTAKTAEKTAVKPVVKKAAAKKTAKTTAKAAVKPAAKKTTRRRAQEEALVETMVQCMQEKKGQHIVSLDLRKVSGASFDFFVICEVDSAPQARAIADEIDEKVYAGFGEDPLHTEGYANGEWVLLDYGNVLAHIFNKETRRHYRLEELWGDAGLREFEEEEN